MLGLPVETAHRLEMMVLSKVGCPGRIDVGRVVVVRLIALRELVDGAAVVDRQEFARILGIVGHERTVGIAVLVEGIGEILKSVDIPEKWYLIIHPNEKVSTKKVFQHPELNCATAKISDTQLFDFKWDNDLEPLVRDLYPAVDNAVRWLQQYSDNARMTGSGACVFGEFDSENEARDVYELIPEGWNAFIAKGCQKSPLFEKLSLVSKNFKL